MLFARPQATLRMASTKVTCHGAGLVAGDADFKNSFTVFVPQGKIAGISVAFEGKLIIIIVIKKYVQVALTASLIKMSSLDSRNN